MVMSKKTLVRWLVLKVVVAACDRKYQIIDTCWILECMMLYTYKSYRLITYYEHELIFCAVNQVKFIPKQ